jgi:hypothetical protein
MEASKSCPCEYFLNDGQRLFFFFSFFFDEREKEVEPV